MSKPLSTDSSEGHAGLLRVDPFRSLRIHFGMLLGVDDFETLDAYHRGKMWLHNAWLHGKGVVWGLAVDDDLDAGEVRVEPGLALDALGRELLLDLPVCLNVAQWLEEHRDETDIKELKDGGERFDAHVVIQFKACLSRQVPALVEPCEGSGQTTAYSRVVETVELAMLPGLAPERHEPPGKLPYHRLRLLFALEDSIKEGGTVIPSDQVVLDRRQETQALPGEDQPRAYLEAFRDFAALDEIDLAKVATEGGDEFPFFPAVEPAPLVLAEITGLTLTPAGELSLAGEVDNTVRFSHVATSTIQELLNGPLCGAVEASEEGDGNGAEGGNGEEEGGDGEKEEGTGEDGRGDAVAVVDAGGPRVDPATVRLTDRQIAFSTSRELVPASVSPEAVSVTAFDEEKGWVPVETSGVRLSPNRRRISVLFRQPPPAAWIRLIAKGTGPRPLLGDGGVPLAGAPTDPPAGAHNGNDFVVMEKRS